VKSLKLAVMTINWWPIPFPSLISWHTQYEATQHAHIAVSQEWQRYTARGTSNVTIFPVFRSEMSQILPCMYINTS